MNHSCIRYFFSRGQASARWMLHHISILTAYPAFHQPRISFGLLTTECPWCAAEHPCWLGTPLVPCKPSSGLPHSRTGYYILHGQWFLSLDIYYPTLLKCTSLLVCSFPNNPDSSAFLSHSLRLPPLTYKLYRWWIYIDVLDLARSYRDHFLAPLLWNLSRNKSISKIISTL